MRKISIFIFALCLFSCKKKQEYQFLAGNAFGTAYNIQFKDQSDRNWKVVIDSIVDQVNLSLSTYIPHSAISKINKGDSTVIIDASFKEVFKKSERIFNESQGVFDPTIGVLVNAWDFGPEKKINDLDSAKVAELMEQVGFDKVRIHNDKIVKEHPKTYLDFNAIAKGYGIDLIGRFFEKNDIADYMVEIGGEIRARGKSRRNTSWKIQIEKPNFDGSRSRHKIIELKDASMATSGTYRKFKVDENGNRYAHILDTKTGYPSKSNLLSASVIASIDCADVDGYATTLMAMGLEKSKVFLSQHKELKAFLIYNDEKGSLQHYQTPNFDN